MAVTFDPTKRDWTLQVGGRDFVDSEFVFSGSTIDVEDTRRDCGETRMISIGTLRGRLVAVAWTSRVGHRHVFSMRKANEREQKEFGQQPSQD